MIMVNHYPSSYIQNTFFRNQIHMPLAPAEGLFLKDVTPAPKLLLDVVTPTPEMIVEHVTPSSVTLSEELLEVVTPSPQPFSDVTPSVQPFSDDVNDETLPAAQSLNDAEKLHSRPVHR